MMKVTRMSNRLAMQAVKVIGVSAAALALALPAAPAAVGAETRSASKANPQEVFDTAPKEKDYFDLSAKTLPSNINVSLPASYKNKRVTVYWQWSGKREVSSGTPRWTQNHTEVYDKPGVPGYAQLDGSFKARLDATPTLRVAVPYREMIDLCWNVDIVIVDRKGKVLRKFVVPHSSAFDRVKANDLVDVTVQSS